MPYKRTWWMPALLGAVMVSRAAHAQPPDATEGMAPAPPPPPVMAPEEALRRAGGPTLLTLHFKDVKPAVVIDEIARQSGVAIQNPRSPEEGAPITIDVDAEPFWLVIQRLLQAGCGVAGWERNRISLYPMPPTAPDTQMLGPILKNGPVLVIANAFIVNRNLTQVLDAAQPSKAQDSFVFRVQVFVDPHLKVMSGTILTATEARDEKGNSLLTEGMTGVGPDSYGARWFQTKNVQLAWRGDAGRRLRFRGLLRLRVVTKTTEWVVPDIANARDVSRQIDKHRVMLTGTKLTEQGGEVSFAIKGWERGQGPIVAYEVLDDMQLTDERGNKFRGRVNVSFLGNSLAVTQNFQPPPGEHGPPTTLTVRIPEEYAILEIPIAFDDLPLPSGF